MCQLEGAVGNGLETEVNGGGTNLTLRKLVYLLPLEGVRGEELVTYSNFINIGLPIGEGLGRSYHFSENDTNGIAPNRAV